MSFSDLVKLKLRELEELKFDPSLSGAHIRDASKIYPGCNLYEGRLMDMDGKVLKKWRNNYLGLILPDGSYLAQEYYESPKWGLFTWDDHVIWESDVPIHHDIALTAQNTILTLTKETHPYKGRNVDFCAVVEFDMKGREIQRWSTWEHLRELKKFHRALELDRPKVFFLPETAKRKEKTVWGGNYDYYRLNSIQVLPAAAPGQKDRRFKAGNWLVSFRHGSMIFILDGDTRQVVWKCIDDDVKDRLEGQHAVSLLKNGNLLVFDNGRYRGWSRVIEINPLTYEILRQYRAENFFTLSQGYVQRFSNGNTLVTESERGRAFEITAAGEIVWEYYHPDIQDSTNSQHPESYGKRQWIYRMVRYEKTMIDRFSAARAD